VKYYQIKRTDVHRPCLKCFGRVHLVSGFLGRILPGDVGKRIYCVKNDAGDSDVLQVENDEQRTARLAKGRRARARSRKYEAERLRGQPHPHPAPPPPCHDASATKPE